MFTKHQYQSVSQFIVIKFDSFHFICVLYSFDYLQTGSNEIIGRVLIGSDRSLLQAHRALFDDLLRSKSATATAQWLSLTDPAIQ